MITGVIRGCIATGYIPERWGETRVVFIPKPGRTGYTETGDFKPISLTSFFLKTAERLVNLYVRSSLLANSLLYVNQHAYQRDKSTETALHNVVGYIEKAIENNEVTIGAFIDIEEAFSCSSRTAIETAALRHGITPIVVRWMVGMLTDRRIYTEWMVKRVEGRVSDTCPQGGGDTK